MSIAIGLLAAFIWFVVLPIAVLVALVLLIVGLSTDDRDVKLRRQRLRLALLFFAIPLGSAVVLSILTAIIAAVETAILTA